MSTHPNAILICHLTPDDLARKTYRAILADAGHDPDEDSPSLKIGGADYSIKIMEESYDEGYQLSGVPGEIIVFDMVTYGYGEEVRWEKLTDQKAALEAWVADVCAKHKCSARFAITANYW